MALVAHALLTLNEAKQYLVAPGTQADQNLEVAINAATDVMESRLDRRIVSRGNITEYHTVEPRTSVIRLSEKPTKSVTSIHESTDWPRVYDSTTLLASSGTLQGYEVDTEAGLVRRISYGLETWWAWGRRAVKVIHEAGYKGPDPNWSGTSTLPAIPWDLKQLALAITSAIYSEGERKGWGIASQQDPIGNIVRFMGWVPPSLMDQLDAIKRIEFERTWERAA